MNDDLPTPTARRGVWRVLGWAVLVAVVAVFGWSGWREYDYRAAVREARAAGFRFEESPTPLAAIRADWRAGLRLATWTERKRMLALPDGTDLAPLRPLLLRLDPTHLQARNCRQLDALRGRTELRYLELSSSDVKDLAPLAGLARLQTLYLGNCTGVADLAPLVGLTQLQSLYLFGCTGVTDLAPLAGLTQLQRLDINGCTGIADLAPLAGLAQLQLLTLGGCTGVTDLAPLVGLAQLQGLSLLRCTGLDAEAVVAFKKGHPRVSIVGPDGQDVKAR